MELLLAALHTCRTLQKVQAELSSAFPKGDAKREPGYTLTAWEAYFIKTSSRYYQTCKLLDLRGCTIKRRS